MGIAEQEPDNGQEAAKRADLAIDRLKNEGRWDDVRFAEVNRSEFQEHFAAANAQGLRA